ncbi:tRNA (adenine57-N1/adenine58-N1)-methyltransferase [Nocardiopsis arvandica]|uniref:tRNA (Adenine57-N1/adenine58-N1)-methyltransferase n=1 Tax=Nocardiopsis sinuspersici TaxID=501010 RepID=A0A7Y9XF71_9ACTN|nr:tRNA (adenine-N1)-methyltransferase [Nocardiopsis sinuspersici]NYH54697.1 tRNA (adenine57-N1/adenine58-N1)-methyltransferase [Nocardiopsis sinuspersici]
MTGIHGRRGPFTDGDTVQLTDPKGRMHTTTLREGGAFHSHKGKVDHDDLIGQPDGSVVRSNTGTAYVALRPLLIDYTLSMKRGATIVYPKDAAQVLVEADIFPGARVVEAGAGSGAMSNWLLRAVGEQGMVHSYERRADFAEIARKNVERFHGGPHPAWRLTVGDLVEELDETDVDRVFLDMLAPWECLDSVARALIPGGLVCCYVATTTQLSRVVEELREDARFYEPRSWETMLRTWHVEGLAVRPDHRMIGHTGFLVVARRLADGVEAPDRRRRPAKGAYGKDFTAARERDREGAAGGAPEPAPVGEAGDTAADAKAPGVPDGSGAPETPGDPASSADE